MLSQPSRSACRCASKEKPSQTRTNSPFGGFSEKYRRCSPIVALRTSSNFFVSSQKEPRLVGYCEKEDTYYELTEEQLATILKENNLDGEKLNKVSFYSRYGGKAVGLLIIALIIWGCIPGKKKEVKPVEV